MAAALAAPCAAASGTSGQGKTAKSDQQKKADMAARIEIMQKQIDMLQKQLDDMRAQQTASQQQSSDTRKKLDTLAKDNKKTKAKVAKVEKKQKNGITVGGAMRFQYSYEDYNKNNVHRTGDADFDIFRLNFRGRVDDIELQAEWRWFQYMSAVKYAWLGYDFSKNQQLQVGLTRIPFGNQPYNSHNYFFSSNYYLGLEDTYHMGVEYVYSGDPWNVQLAFFKNDGMGGIDGYVSNRSNSYSYNVVGVRSPGEGIYADPQHPAASINTAAARVAYTFKPNDDLKIELGASGLHGGLEGPSSSIGNYSAYALHMNADYKRLNVQAQASRYDYNVDGGADRLAVGAYAFYDTIAAKADSYTFNVKYHQPVQWGPVHGLDFYNDYSLITNKSGQLPSTFMNILGVGVSAGDLYTYFDFVTARNQPFIGGSMAGDGKVEHRFNINFGFYF
ncbi:hypothetical protein BTJ49_13755 [Oleiagrimonas sp. MCCC 1A03011]|nr:hypothetical protein BTJ49_13755 [Oleiagrimonas sp. MCCC 1A03011]